PGSPPPGVAGPPAGAFGAFTDADYLPARPGRRALKRTALVALALVVLGGALYAGYRWTQSQYYIGANGDHVALYQGISQDLGPLSLSSVEQDHPEIRLEHLPRFQRDQVEESISTGSLGEAEDRIAELAEQAEACRLLAEQEQAQADRQNELNEQGGEGDGKDASNPEAAPQTPSLSERQRELARDC
ncbi:protein phosphatase, partial [Streptomyces sp. URMC 129]